MVSSAVIHRKTHQRLALLSVALIISVLFAQWLGYAHWVAHADSINEATRLEVTKAGIADHQKTASACAAFDAATLGASLHTPALTLAAVPLPSLTPEAATPAGNAPAFFIHFSSRAPPLKA